MNAETENYIYRIAEIASAAGVTKHQIHQWVSRGHFEPTHIIRPGQSRLFTNQEKKIVCAIAELCRTGYSAKAAARIVRAGGFFYPNGFHCEIGAVKFVIGNLSA